MYWAEYTVQFVYPNLIGARQAPTHDSLAYSRIQTDDSPLIEDWLKLAKRSEDFKCSEDFKTAEVFQLFKKTHRF